MAVKKTPKTAARTAAKTGTGATKRTSPARAKVGAAGAGKGTGQRVNPTQAHVAQAVTAAKQNAEKTSEAAIKGYDDLAVLGQGNFEAFVASNSAVAKGFEAIGKEFLAFAQRSVEGHMAQARALIGAKDVQEFVELQNDYAKRRLEDTIAETAKLTELSTQVASEAIEPLKKRVDATVETVLKAKAA
jgi:phasin family protein